MCKRVYYGSGRSNSPRSTRQYLRRSLAARVGVDGYDRLHDRQSIAMSQRCGGRALGRRCIYGEVHQYIIHRPVHAVSASLWCATAKKILAAGGLRTWTSCAHVSENRCQRRRRRRDLKELARARVQAHAALSSGSSPPPSPSNAAVGWHTIRRTGHGRRQLLRWAPG